MRIALATPALPGSPTGNGTTAGRWARILRELGHRVRVGAGYDGRPCDLLVALHAQKSAAAVERFRRLRPGCPIVVGLAGTDLYRDIRTSRRAQRVLEQATRLVLLQPRGVDELPRGLRRRARVIHQSVAPPKRRTPPLKSSFEVLVVANLRPVKDPFRAALAARGLPPSSRIRVTHAGIPLGRGTERRALAESARNPRYRWVGPRTHGSVLRLLTRCRLLCLSSKAEGGANAISEALAVPVPIVASAIPGTIGLLGEDYPGYFPAGDTGALRALLLRVETEADFRRALAGRCRALGPLVRPAREKRAWRALLRELRQGS